MQGNHGLEIVEAQMIISDCLEQLGYKDFAREARLTSDCKILNRFVNVINWQAKRKGRQDIVDTLYSAGFIDC